MKSLIILMFLSNVAYAVCPRQTYSDPDKRPDYNCPSPGEDSMVPRVSLKTSVELEVGKKAPWTGVLMGTNRVLKLGLRIKALRRIRWSETTSWIERRKIEQDYLTGMHKVEKAFVVKQRDIWKQQAMDAHQEIESRRKWYRSNAFWFSAGVVVTAAGAAILASGLRK